MSQIQDWKPVVLVNSANIEASAQRKGNIEIKSKTTSGTTDTPAYKMDDPDWRPTCYVDLKLANTIKSAREAKKLTQADLAKACSLDPSIVRKYEDARSKTIPESKILEKFSKVLGVTLRKPPKKKAPE